MPGRFAQRRPPCALGAGPMRDTRAPPRGCRRSRVAVSSGFYIIHESLNVDERRKERETARETVRSAAMPVLAKGSPVPLGPGRCGKRFQRMRGFMRFHVCYI